MMVLKVGKRHTENTHGLIRYSSMSTLRPKKIDNFVAVLQSGLLVVKIGFLLGI
jgi:hypothetical protein